ncbi:hypothetical protein [Terrimonas pollutisoli]|uniref:hypothetical protein n=1 Tax=Terrimonas pollutisoli TaxID=3034147 RepID=UPI0023EA7DBD|nr:hypothetical protein [Terrimonas sp. H1YJ31]
MAFEINEVVAQMLGAVKASVKDDWKLVKETAGTFLQTRQDRLELLASLRLNNEISQKFFLKRLEDEKKILESELHSVAILTKAAAQRAANAAIDVLSKAVAKLLPL